MLLGNVTLQLASYALEEKSRRNPRCTMQHPKMYVYVLDFS